MQDLVLGSEISSSMAVSLWKHSRELKEAAIEQHNCGGDRAMPGFFFFFFLHTHSEVGTQQKQRGMTVVMPCCLVPSLFVHHLGNRPIFSLLLVRC